MPKTEKIVFKTLSQVHAAIEAYQALNAEKKALEETIKEQITGPLAEYMKGRKLKELPMEDLGVSVQMRTRVTKKLDPDLLLQNRVPAAVIAKCTVETESAPYCQIQPIGSRGGKGGSGE